MSISSEGTLEKQVEAIRRIFEIAQEGIRLIAFNSKGLSSA